MKTTILLLGVGIGVVALFEPTPFGELLAVSVITYALKMGSEGKKK